MNRSTTTMMNAAYKQLRDSAYNALRFDAPLQTSFRLAIKDAELNAAPDFSRMAQACREVVQILADMPEGWHYEETELVGAMEAVCDFSDSLS